MATCVVQGTIVNLDGTPSVEAQVRASARSTEEDGSGQIVGGEGVTSEPVVAFTDEKGSFSMALLQGTVVLLEIPSIHLRRAVTVPSVEGPVDFTSLL